MMWAEIIAPILLNAESMKLNIRGRHLTVPPEVEDYARDKIGRLDKYFAGIQHGDVTLGIDGHGTQRTHSVEASVTLSSVSAVATIMSVAPSR